MAPTEEEEQWRERVEVLTRAEHVLYETCAKV